MIHNDIRLLAVERFKALDLQGDSEFQELIKMASETCDTPIALITLIDADTQWIKVSKSGTLYATPRELSFCTHTIQQDDALIVPDTLKDERFSNNPIVVNEPHARFYAGVPLVTHEGQTIGSLCVADIRPRDLDKQQLLMLKMLSRQAINLMEFKISVEILEQNQIELHEQKEIIRKAEIMQRSFFESAPNFHILLGKNGEVLDFNKVAYIFIQRVHKTALTKGTYFVPYLAPDFVDKFMRGFERALKGEHAFEEGSTDYGAHGIIYWEASFETARDPENEIIGISYIIRDVTDRKVKEIKILTQNQSLLKIAHVQAHEFRAPLTTITGMMDLIKAEDYNAPKEYYELLENAVRNLDNKIKEIVNDIDTMVPSNGTEVHSN